MNRTVLLLDDQKTQSSYEFGKSLESYDINQFEVLVSEGIYKGSVCYYFTAYNKKNNHKIMGSYGYTKDDADDMKKYNEYTLMNEAQKKRFIKKALAESDVDIGPVE